MGSEQPAINPDQFIKERLHVHRADPVPYTGWTHTVSRIGLAQIFNDLGYKTGAEIGVERGYYSRTLCEKIPGLKLYCIDPWVPYRGNRPSQRRLDAYMEFAKNLLKGFDATIIRKSSLDAVKDFKDGSLDFVYIDAMHEFDPCIMDIISWSPKVRPGGIVAGHDFAWGPCFGVVNAVQAYATAHNIKDWYVTNNEDRGRTRSWFWVKK